MKTLCEEEGNAVGLPVWQSAAVDAHRQTGAWSVVLFSINFRGTGILACESALFTRQECLDHFTRQECLGHITCYSDDSLMDIVTGHIGWVEIVCGPMFSGKS